MEAFWRWASGVGGVGYGDDLDFNGKTVWYNNCGM